MELPTKLGWHMPLICQNKNTIISLQFQIAIPFYSIRKIAVFRKKYSDYAGFNFNWQKICSNYFYSLKQTKFSRKKITKNSYFLSKLRCAGDWTFQRRSVSDAVVSIQCVIKVISSPSLKVKRKINKSNRWRIGRVCSIIIDHSFAPKNLEIHPYTSECYCRDLCWLLHRAI